jgi:hypothetical protein
VPIEEYSNHFLVILISPGWARSLRYSSTILCGLSSLSWEDFLSNQRDIDSYRRRVNAGVIAAKVVSESTSESRNRERALARGFLR